MPIVLAPTPATRKYRVLIGTSVRKSATILKAHLQTLAWQECPNGVEREYCFVLDTEDAEVIALLEAFVVEHGGDILRPGKGPEDTNDAHPVTHQWSPAGMARVGAYKDLILAKAKQRDADAVWFVDADLLLDKTTFASLWSQNAAIACAVYWTHWHNPGRSAGLLHAAPQVWLTHPYGLEGRGYEVAEFRAALVTRQRTQVWGQGACTLIRRVALEKGMSFGYVPGQSTEGMMAGEDRHFCLRAESLHLPMFADPWPDIFHVYHPEDVAHIPEMLARLGTTHQESPAMGDDCSVILEALEPVPTGPNTASMIPPVYWRGRLGGGQMVPELEERIGQMARGQSSILGVHFPAHHPAAFLRGQRRLIRVTLVDCKAHGYAPVVEHELLQGTTLKGHADRTALTFEQQDAIQADRVAFEEAVA